MGSKRPDFGDGASPGKIFIGGLAKDTTFDTFVKYFSKYGEVTDSVVMKDRQTGRPRGFGFITYADPSVVDTVIAETHVINGKQVEIKRTIPKGGSETRDFKTRKIFVGGIPSSVNEDELKDFFSNYGNVVEHEIIREHASKRSRGFGFIVFESEEVVENLVAGGNKIDMAGTQVEIKKAEPKKPSNSAPRNAYGNEPRGRAYGEDFGGFGNSYSGFGSGRLGSASYRSFGGGIGGRFGGDYGGYGGGRGGEEFGGRYGNFGGYRGEQPSFDDSSRFGSYSGGGGGGGGGGYGGGFGGGSSAYGGYGRGGGGSYGGGYAGGGYAGASFESGLGAGPAGFEPGGGGYGGGGGLYGSRGGYGGSGGGGSAGRYHPYSR